MTDFASLTDIHAEDVVQFHSAVHCYAEACVSVSSAYTALSR